MVVFKSGILFSLKRLAGYLYDLKVWLERSVKNIVSGDGLQLLPLGDGELPWPGEAGGDPGPGGAHQAGWWWGRTV